MTDITDIIKSKLDEIEQRENIHILFACESGSRAWGFASPDSDYDVRFVYARPVKDYLRLDPVKDTMECELNEVYDINGWDLKKFLQHVFKSNPVMFEWAQSPIVYKITENWKKIAAVMNEYFLESEMLHHYCGMAKSNIRSNFQGDEIVLKKYLYVLRPVLAASWVFDKKKPAPTEFQKLVNEELPYGLVKSVNQLLEIKKNAGEKETGCRMADIDDFMERKLNMILGCSSERKQKNEAWKKLNDLFWEVING